jgi:predicted RNA-binding protein with PIN domain
MGKGRRGGKRGSGKKKGGKVPRRERKQQRKAEKQEKRELKQQRKMEKKQEKEERKRLKREKKEKLEAARLDALPSKADIGGNDTLVLYVDGYNIIGCDSVCRKSMRGRGGGMKKSRTRIATLLQREFVNKLASLKLEYGVLVNLWFDGNGKDEKFGDIHVSFSSKKQIVDDKLVETFSRNAKEQNANILVVTSDRELTLRLNEIGVKVMKSGTFYNSFLKEKEEKASNDDDAQSDNGDDEKDAEEDQFVMMMAKKLNQNTADTDNEDEDDAETPGADSYDHTDDGNDTQDEVEGGNPTDDEDYSEGGDNDEDDYEFTAIFGEDFAPDFDQN